jgi:hypothetical protein
MKIANMGTKEISTDQHMQDMLMNLELGNLYGEQGNEQQAIDHYIRGLQIARELGDKARVQQFSNLILTYI